MLIVEDNELNMKLFHDLLEAHGYDTVGTRNGVEAIELARTHRPDLILMDIQLRGFRGGSQVDWTIRVASDPVVAVTAFAMKGDEERIRQVAARPVVETDFGGQIRETIRASWYGGRAPVTALHFSSPLPSPPMSPS